MRHNKLLTIATAAFVFALQQIATTVAQEAQPSWAGVPVIGHARIAPLDRLQRDFAFLAEGVEQGSTTAIRELFTELSMGIDARRPVGVALLYDAKFVPVIFAPVKDEGRLFTILDSRLGWKFRREADGFYRYTDTTSKIDLVARVAGTWVYLTGFSHREMLREVPSDPTVLFEGSDPTLTAHITLNVDQLPPEMHAKLVSSLGDAPTGAEGKSIVNDAVMPIGQWVRQFLAETKSLQLDLQCFRPLKQFHVTSSLTAVAGSELARWIDDTSQRPALFSHLSSNDSVFAAVSSLKLGATAIQPLLDAWEPFAAAAQADAPSQNSENPAEALLGRLVAQSINAVTKTLAKGELDFGLVIEPQGRDQVVLLAGTTLQDARALEQTAIEVGNLLQQSPDFRDLEWSVSGDGDVSLHQLVIPSTDATTRTLFGDPASLAIGVGTDRLYAAFGGAALARLSEAVDRSREDTPERGVALHASARMAPFLAMLDNKPGENAEIDNNVHEYAELIAPFKKNDALELSITAKGRTLEGRLSVDMGIVRMLAPTIPTSRPTTTTQQPSELAGTLRLPKNEKFQLAFHTASEITTTIDGNDRLDRGVYSLTYDFRVLNVDNDGTMHLETSLSRAAIDKIAPEGREVFDSRNNPPTANAMTAEMILYGTVIGKVFVVAVRPDGSIAEISGIAEAIENALDQDLKPPPDERERARAFVGQLLNEASMRDSLTRGFEFYPGHAVSAGNRWKRTSQNFTPMSFLLDSRYQMKAISADEVVVSVRSQVRQTEEADSPDQPQYWEVVGSQSGTIALDPDNGRLRLAEFTMRLDAELTFEMEGNTVSRPMESVFKMTVGQPQFVAQKVATALEDN